MRRSGQLGIGLGLLLGLLALRPPGLEAHGEVAQDAFIRTRTIAFYDVTFSGRNFKVGEDLTVTGKFFVSADWPAGFAKPDLGYLTAAAPGPVMLVKERWLNGVFTPGSVSLRQGEEYEFKLVLRARREGRYHVHPMVAVQGVGPLLGPGGWVGIGAAGAAFTNPLALWDGRTVDLETYGLPRIVTWHAIAFALGAAWVLYWLAQPILRRSLWVASGAEDKLITRRDLRVSAALGIATAVAILAGTLTTHAAYRHTIPHQVVRVDVPPRPQPAPSIEIRREVARYTHNPVARTLTLEVQVTNRGDKPARLRQFVTSMVSFVNREVAPDAEHLLVVEPGAVVNPGETKVLKLRMTDPVWEQQRLIDMTQPQLRFGGVLIFETPAGARSLAGVDAPLQPYFRTAS
jgi:methane/ammonia monooxygenase subunit B